MIGRFFLVTLVAGASACALAACASTAHPTSSVPAPTPCAANAESLLLAGESAGRILPGGEVRSPYVLGKIAVRYVGTGTEPEIARAITRVGARILAAQTPSGYTIYSIPESSDPASVAASVRGTRGIVEAQPLRAVYPQAGIIPNDVDFGVASQLLIGPQHTPVQWDMYIIDMPDAWTITEGSSAAPIAIIDTGYDLNNADVAPKVIDSAVFDLGGGAQDVGATLQDNNGHGTNVSGIAASVTNDITRFAGVGWNIPLIEVRVFPQPTPTNPNPGASNFDIAQAIKWAVMHGAKVINLSVGFPGACDPSIGAAITSANAAGVTVVAASGNESTTTVDTPGNCPGAIAVGASALDDTVTPTAEKIAHYSNSGPQLALVAPGGDPPNACSTDYLQWITNNYSQTALKFPGTSVFIAGTSQATPHVSGVAALMISKRSTIQPGEVKLILQQQVDDICKACPGEGAGRLNAFKALSNT